MIVIRLEVPCECAFAELSEDNEVIFDGFKLKNLDWAQLACMIEGDNDENSVREKVFSMLSDKDQKKIAANGGI